MVGRADVEDSLARLDRLTQEEVRMAAAQGLKATQAVYDEVNIVGDHIQQVDDKLQQVADDVGDQKRSSSNNLIGLAISS